MLRFGLHVEGLDAAISRMDGLRQQLILNMTVALEWFASTVTNEMITQHSFQNRTGRLERSIGYTLNMVDNQLQLQVFALAPYAVAVEQGVPGHSAPYPFFWPTFYKWLPDLYLKLEEGVESALSLAEDTGRLSAGLA